MAAIKDIFGVQKRLKELGLYTGALDGDAGPLTYGAIEKALSSLKVEAAKTPVLTQTKAIAQALPTWMDDLILILEEFEAFKSKAYWDATGKVWTIGIGTTIYPNGTKVKKGDACTRAQAVGYVQHDVMTIRKPAIEKMVTKALNDNQMAALVSFCYNVGVGSAGDKQKRGFYWSNLRKNINAGVTDKAKLTTNFMAFSQSGGVTLTGLKKRRLAESKLYFTPVVVQKLAVVDQDKDAALPAVDTPRYRPSIRRAGPSETTANPYE